MSNILWQNLTPRQIRTMIREWPVDAAVAPKASRKAVVKVTKQVKAPEAAAPKVKYTGADGEVKFIEHRNLFLGFMGGKAVAKSKTEAGCRAILKRIYNI